MTRIAASLLFVSTLLLAACGPGGQPAAKPTEPVKAAPATTAAPAAKDAAPAKDAAAKPAAAGGPVIFFSSQFKPIEEAEKMRQVILKESPVAVEFIPEDPGPFNDRLTSEQKAG